MMESLWKISGELCEKPFSLTRTVNALAVWALDCIGVNTTADKRTKINAGKAMRRMS
jgi:hypothetical protein